MALYKNVASQKLAVYAHDTAADAAKTGDAAQISAQISLDGGATAATNDAAPTELDAADAPGIYIFDLTQAETNADLVIVCPVSSTADVSLEPVIIYTLPGTNAGVSADATKINGVAAAAARLALSAGQIIPGTVNDDNTVPSTTVFAASDITEATADHYNGRLVVWTTGALAGQVTDVTDYALDTGEGKFTVTEMTEAPADGDTFVLV